MNHAPRIRFLHTSDWQLGMTRVFLRGEAQARFADSRLAAVRKLGDIAQEKECAFVVAAGDLFEHNSVTDRVYARAREVLMRFPLPLWVLPGNHDALVPDSVLRRIAAEVPMVHLLDTSNPVEAVPGIDLVGAPLYTRHPGRDLVGEAIRDLQPSERVRIVVGHGAVVNRESGINPSVINVESLSEYLAAGVIQYVALGDTHSTTEVVPRVWYSGAPETTDFREQNDGGERDSGNVLVVNLDEGGCKIEKVSVGVWRFEALHDHLNSPRDVAVFLDRLRAYSEKERTVVKYSLSGTLSLDQYAFLQRELAAMSPAFAALYERRRLMDLQVAPTKEDLESLDLSGYARSALQELIENRETDALNLLFRLAKREA